MSEREELLKERIIRRVLANKYTWGKRRIGQVRSLEEGAVFLLEKIGEAYIGLLVSPDFAYPVAEFGTLFCLTIQEAVTPYSQIPIDPLAGYLHLWAEVTVHKTWLKGCLADFSCASVAYVLQEKQKEFNSDLPVNLTVKHLQNKLIDKWLKFTGNLKSLEA